MALMVKILILLPLSSLMLFSFLFIEIFFLQIKDLQCWSYKRNQENKWKIVCFLKKIYLIKLIKVYSAGNNVLTLARN